MRLTRTVRRQPERERWERSNLDKIVWRKNEDDPEMDGEKLEGEVVMMDKDYKGKLEREEHVPVPKRLCITREKFGRIWIHCAMSPMHVVAQVSGATGAHRGMSKQTGSGTEGHCEGRSFPKTYEGAHGQSSRETGEVNEIEQKTQGGTAGQADEGMPAQGSGGSSSSSAAKGASKLEDSEERDRTDKTDGEHPEDPGRSHLKWTRS